MVGVCATTVRAVVHFLCGGADKHRKDEALGGQQLACGSMDGLGSLGKERDTDDRHSEWVL